MDRNNNDVLIGTPETAYDLDGRLLPVQFFNLAGKHQYAFPEMPFCWKVRDGVANALQREARIRVEYDGIVLLVGGAMTRYTFQQLANEAVAAFRSGRDPLKAAIGYVVTAELLQ